MTSLFQMPLIRHHVSIFKFCEISNVSRYSAFKMWLVRCFLAFWQLWENYCSEKWSEVSLADYAKILWKNFGYFGSYWCYCCGDFAKTKLLMAGPICLAVGFWGIRFEKFRFDYFWSLTIKNRILYKFLYVARFGFRS